MDFSYGERVRGILWKLINVKKLDGDEDGKREEVGLMEVRIKSTGKLVPGTNSRGLA